jgi:hypothetical protein
LFGIFSEEIVRIWCDDQQSPYHNLGRPTLRLPNEPRGSTLDFALQSRQDRRIFVGELKCELEFENYRYLALTSSSQLEHHTGEAFKRFLDLAKNPSKYSVTVNGQSMLVVGAILIWGSVTAQGRMSVMKEKGLAEVLSLEQIIIDLLEWGSEVYLQLIEQRATWCRCLFDGLARKA